MPRRQAFYVFGFPEVDLAMVMHLLLSDQRGHTSRKKVRAFPGMANSVPPLR